MGLNVFDLQSEMNPPGIQGLNGCRGFSLVEMMVALSLLTVCLLGLWQLVMTSMGANQQNDVRNTAVRMAADTAETILAQPLANLASGSLVPYAETNEALAPDFRQFPNPIQSIRGRDFTYTVSWQVAELSEDLRQVTITVQYDLRGRTHTNSTVVFKHRAI